MLERRQYVPVMSDIVGANYENSIKLGVPGEDKPIVPVKKRSGRFWGLSHKGLFALLTMLPITTALALGIGLHFAAAQRDHTRKRIPTHFRTEDLLSNYVQPL